MSAKAMVWSPHFMAQEQANQDQNAAFFVLIFSPLEVCERTGLQRSFQRLDQGRFLDQPEDRQAFAGDFAHVLETEPMYSRRWKLGAAAGTAVFANGPPGFDVNLPGNPSSRDRPPPGWRYFPEA